MQVSHDDIGIVGKDVDPESSAAVLLRYRSGFEPSRCMCVFIGPESKTLLYPKPEVDPCGNQHPNIKPKIILNNKKHQRGKSLVEWFYWAATVVGLFWSDQISSWDWSTSENGLQLEVKSSLFWQECIELQAWKMKWKNSKLIWRFYSVTEILFFWTK